MKSPKAYLSYAFFFILVSATLLEGYMYLQTNSRIETLAKENSVLGSRYTDLNDTYGKMKEKYSNLTSEQDALRAELSVISTRYNELLERYNRLLMLVDRPLRTRLIPTVSELESWLKSDETDKLTYQEDFNCLDFSLTLSEMARTNNWKMGVVFVHGYNNVTLEKYVHAFNAILTAEGLVYVEPMTDQIWWYSEHRKIEADRVYVIGYKPIMVEQVEILLACA